VPGGDVPAGAGEEMLGLGAMNRVWRVGDTIRRSRGPWSDTIAALLHHLERKGFQAAPRHLGVDELGRDILSVIQGTPVATLRGDEQLVQAAVLLRTFHEASADFVAPAGARWQINPATAAGGQRIIHRDVAPWNLLESGGMITGLIDWDLAGPGRLVEDFAYMAWHFVPLHGELLGDGRTGPPVADRPRRLRLLADTYRLTRHERTSLTSEVAAMEVRQATRVADQALAGDQASVGLWRAGRFTEATGRSLTWLAEHRNSLEEAL
jgi:thiamine kinase-like enzyme